MSESFPPPGGPVEGAVPPPTSPAYPPARTYLPEGDVAPSGDPVAADVPPPPVVAPVAPPAASYPPPVDPPAAFPPPAGEPVGGAAYPAGTPYGAPPLGAPELLASGSVLPPVEEPRRQGRGKVVVAATLGVLLVLLAGGAAYGWSFLNRADVKLARAFDATRSSAGDLSVSVEGEADSPSIRYAWTADGTAQVQVSPAGGKVAFDLITTSNHLVIRIDPTVLPEGTTAVDQLRTIADTFGPDGAALTALADGKPVGIAIGPGSRLQKLIDEASASASPNPDAAAVQQQVSALADAIVTSVKDNVTVESVGSDQYGDRSTMALPLKPVVTQALESLKSSVPALRDSVSSADLGEIEGRTVHADVWVSDGRLARIAVPFSQFGDTGQKGVLVITFGTAGVQQPTEDVTEVTDALLDKVLGGLPALGGGDASIGG
jgi:hypothetical protein